MQNTQDFSKKVLPFLIYILRNVNKFLRPAGFQLFFPYFNKIKTNFLYVYFFLCCDLLRPIKLSKKLT